MLDSPASWLSPFPSVGATVFGAGIAATSQCAASQIALSILDRGGSAVDAAIAAAAALTVCEPTTNGLGGDLFALVWDGNTLHGLNASGRSPAALRADMIQGAKYPTRGWLPVTVPGQVDGWSKLHSRFGTLPFCDCLDGAIRLARDGFLLAPLTAEMWSRAAKGYSDEAAWCDTFLVHGSAPRAGERVRLADHARALESIARTHGECVYRGEIADAILKYSDATGGLFSRADLESHQSEWVAPISMRWRGHRLWEIPPSGQGIAALIAVGVMDRIAPRDGTGGGVLDAPRIHRMIEAIKLGFLVAHAHVADAGSMRISTSELLSSTSLDGLATRFDPTRAQDFLAGTPKPGGTVQLCTADRNGMMVSLIQSNYTGFGSGLVVREFGFALQNRGACFTLDAHHPNCVAGSKRPYHTIIPGFLTRITAQGQDEATAALGVMGGFMQPQGHLQLVSHLLDSRLSPQGALDAPRWQWMEEKRVRFEPGFPDETTAQLRALGHHVEIASRADVAFGRGQIIARIPSGYAAGSDFRADGCASAQVS
ncbi:MAG: gamma-glutamyltransferase family protein [Planctomycetota bacterium]|nr:gamma-glutamyltransferase family protein [Planctomycetota bacterium]